jgi:nitrous oxide reductase
MSDDAKNDTVSRRGFLGMGSAALAAAGMLSAADAAGQAATNPTATETEAVSDERQSKR